MPYDHTATEVTRRSLFSWVVRSDMKLQLSLLAVILVTVALRVVPLELQKMIINEAISFKKLDLLYMYSGYYLAAVLAASALKYVINALQTFIGQRALTDIRTTLYQHIIRLPLSYFRKTQPGMVVSSLVGEVAPAGEFVGMAIAIPVTNILTLLAFGGYLFYLDPLMGAISMAIYPVVVFIIPWLQRRTNEANKTRVDITREMSSKVAETISGIHEVHGNSSQGLEDGKFESVAERLRRIRVVWNLYKYAIKVLNNLFVNLAPFLLFIVGGWLIINGRFDIGSLVAFLSAQEKLYDPWKELMDFYQVYQDADVRYTRTMEYFDAPLDAPLVAGVGEPRPLAPTVDVEKLSFTVGGGIHLLRNVDLHLDAGEHLALVGFSGSGKSTLALCIGQLYPYTAGSIRIGDHEVSEMTRREVVENVGFISQSPFIFSGSFRDNLLYSWSALYDGREDAHDPPTRDDLIAILQQTGIFVDVLGFGLRTALTRQQDEELAEAIVRVRHDFQADFGEQLVDVVEFFDETRYMQHADVAQNIAFGSPRRDDLTRDELAHNEEFTAFLRAEGLHEPLVLLGRSLARQSVDILANMPHEPFFFEQTPVTPEGFDEVAELAVRVDKAESPADMEPDDARTLLTLGLSYIPGRHRLVAMDPELEQRLLSARPRFRAYMTEHHPSAIVFYDRSGYIYGQTIMDNILFGRSVSDSPKTQDRIAKAIYQTLIQHDLLERIVDIGMDYDVGSKGDKLSGGQRQKLAIARVFLRKPPLVIMDEATSALDNKSQTRIQNYMANQLHGRSTVIAVVHRLDIVKDFDKVAVMKAGKIVEMGTHDELMDKRGAFHKLSRGKG